MGILDKLTGKGNYEPLDSQTIEENQNQKKKLTEINTKLEKTKGQLTEVTVPLHDGTSLSGGKVKQLRDFYNGDLQTVKALIAASPGVEAVQKMKLPEPYSTEFGGVEDKKLKKLATGLSAEISKARKALSAQIVALDKQIETQKKQQGLTQDASETQTKSRRR